MNITIVDGLATMLVPFNQFWNPSHCTITCKLVGFEQWETDVVFYDAYDDILEIPESAYIQRIVDLWGEECFYDLIHNQFIDHIFQNMCQFGICELKIKL